PHVGAFGPQQTSKVAVAGQGHHNAPVVLDKSQHRFGEHAIRAVQLDRGMHQQSRALCGIHLVDVLLLIRLLSASSVSATVLACSTQARSRYSQVNDALAGEPRPSVKIEFAVMPSSTASTSMPSTLVTPVRRHSR